MTDQTTEQNRSSGFTLLEMLVGLVIMMVIALVISKVIALGSDAFANGSRRADVNLTGRAVIDLMSRDFEIAIASPRFPATLNNNASTFTFHVLDPKEDETTGRWHDIYRVEYSVSSDHIVRRLFAINMANDSSIPVSTNGLLCNGIQSFRIQTEGGQNYTTNLPYFVDVYMMVRSDIDAELAASSGAFSDRNDRQFGSKLYLPMADRNTYRE